MGVAPTKILKMCMKNTLNMMKRSKMASEKERKIEQKDLKLVTNRPEILNEKSHPWLVIRSARIMHI